MLCCVGGLFTVLHAFPVQRLRFAGWRLGEHDRHTGGEGDRTMELPMPLGPSPPNFSALPTPCRLGRPRDRIPRSAEMWLESVGKGAVGGCAAVCNDGAPSPRCSWLRAGGGVAACGPAAPSSASPNWPVGMCAPFQTSVVRCHSPSAFFICRTLAPKSDEEARKTARGKIFSPGGGTRSPDPALKEGWAAQCF